MLMWTVQIGTLQSFNSSQHESLVWTGLYISVLCFCVLVVWLLNLSGERKVPQCFQFRDILPVCAKTAVQFIQTGFSCRHESRSGRIYCSIRLANVRIKSWFLLGSLILGGSALTASCWRCLILDLTTRLFLCFAARCFCDVVIQNVFMLETENSCFHQFVFLYVELNCLFLTLTVDFLW